MFDFCEVLSVIIKHAKSGCGECERVVVSLAPLIPVLTSAIEDIMSQDGE